MDPIIGSALIGAGGSLLGGMIGESGGNKSAYREAATQTMQAKIRTARQMGVHPLYALGAATPSPKQVIPGQSALGSAAKEAAAHLAAVPLQKAQVKAQEAQANFYNAQANAINKEVNSTGGSPHGAAGGSSAQSFPAEGPYDPRKMPARPALVPVRQPDGQIDLIGNQEAGLENPEFLAAWYMFKNYMQESKKRLGAWMGEILVPMYHATKGLDKNQILDEMIRQLDRRHGAGVRD